MNKTRRVKIPKPAEPKPEPNFAEQEPFISLEPGEVLIEGKSILDDPALKAERLKKIDEDREKLENLSFPEKSMSGDYVAAQLRQAAQQLGPVISNLDQQKSELLLKEVEKIAKHLRELANLICEAVALGRQPTLFDPETEENKPKLAKTLLTLYPPEKKLGGLDQKSLAAGEKPEPFVSLDERADAAP